MRLMGRALCDFSDSISPPCTLSANSVIAHLYFCNQNAFKRPAMEDLSPAPCGLNHLSQPDRALLDTHHLLSVLCKLPFRQYNCSACVSPPLSLSTWWFLYLPKPNHRRQAVSEVFVLVTVAIPSQLCRLSNHITIRLSLLIGQNTHTPRQTPALPDCHLCIKTHNMIEEEI